MIAFLVTIALLSGAAPGFRVIVTGPYLNGTGVGQCVKDSTGGDAFAVEGTGVRCIPAPSEKAAVAIAVAGSKSIKLRSSQCQQISHEDGYMNIWQYACITPHGVDQS